MGSFSFFFSSFFICERQYCSFFQWFMYSTHTHWNDIDENCFQKERKYKKNDQIWMSCHVRICIFLRKWNFSNWTFYPTHVYHFVSVHFNKKMMINNNWYVENDLYACSWHMQQFLALKHIAPFGGRKKNIFFYFFEKVCFHPFRWVHFKFQYQLLRHNQYPRRKRIPN